MISIAFLVSCGTFTPKPTGSIATMSPIESPTAIPTLPIPTSAGPTPLPKPTPLPASLPKFPLDGYILLLTKDSNLYFQDRNLPPVKLAFIEGENHAFPPYFYMLSDDGQKVVFYQTDRNIYSINTDGSQEGLIIPKTWLNPFKTGTQLGVLNFIHHTHLLFFETLLCKEKSSISLCSTSIFLADADTGKVRNLTDLGLALQNYDPSIQNNIKFSPDGKMMVVGTMDGLKILALDGKIIRQKILPYKPCTPDDLFPILFWLPDSSGLIVALPNTIYHSDYWGDITAYTIWRYMIESNSSVQIPFKSPVAGSLAVSPDGNWIVYGAISPAESELYLGNLADGNIKTFGNDVRKNFSWSPDSKHFIHGQTVVISFDMPPVNGGGAPMWVDSNHFVYLDVKSVNPAILQDRNLMGEIREDEIRYYDLDIPFYNLVSIRPK
jgi:hypothetical protein